MFAISQRSGLWTFFSWFIQFKSKQTVKPPSDIIKQQLANHLYIYVSMLARYILISKNSLKCSPLTDIHQYKCPSKEYLNSVTFREVKPPKDLAHYFSFKNMTAICWSPPPTVCWQVEVRAFLVFLIFWFVERAGNAVISEARLVADDINHLVICLKAGFRYTFTSRSAKERAGTVARALGRLRTRNKNITLSHTFEGMSSVGDCSFVHECLWETGQIRINS